MLVMLFLHTINIYKKNLTNQIIGIYFISCGITTGPTAFGVSTIEGIKRHGDKAVAIMLTEFAQLNDKNVFKPRDLSELS